MHQNWLKYDYRDTNGDQLLNQFMKGWPWESLMGGNGNKSKPSSYLIIVMATRIQAVTNAQEKSLEKAWLPAINNHWQWLFLAIVAKMPHLPMSIMAHQLLLWKNFLLQMVRIEYYTGILYADICSELNIEWDINVEKTAFPIVIDFSVHFLVERLATFSVWLV